AGARSMAEATLPPAAPSHRSAEHRNRVPWSYVLTVGRAAITMLVLFVLARLLGPHAFGVLALALVFVLFSQVVLQNGLIAALVQRADLDEDHLVAGFWIVLGGGTVLAVGTALIGPLWGSLIGVAGLGAVCLGLAPMVVIQALTSVPEAMLLRQGRLRTLAVCNLVAAVLAGGLGVLLALRGAGVWALVAQQVATVGLYAVALWLATRWLPHGLPNRAAVRDLRRFSSRAAVAGAGYLIAFRAGDLVIGAFLGPAAVGAYRLARRLTETTTELAVKALQMITLADLARLQHDRQRAAWRYRELQHIGALLGLPALGTLAGVAAPLTGLLGPEWSDATMALRLLCVAAVSYVFGSLLGPALEALGRPGLLAKLAWLQGAVAVGLFALVGYQVGKQAGSTQLLAIVAATVVVELALTALMLHVAVRRVMGVSTWTVIAPTLPSFAGGLIAFGGVTLLQRATGGYPPLLELVVSGLAGLALAATAVLATDRLARGLVRRVVARTRAAVAGPRAARIGGG
ncbi:MAG: lipopolysaccharide biosynthesis protein, partial [Natronosporangium sp.]